MFFIVQGTFLLLAASANLTGLTNSCLFWKLKRFWEVVDGVITAAIMETIFLMYILTVDRLVGVIYPLQHKFFLSTCRIKVRGTFYPDPGILVEITFKLNYLFCLYLNFSFQTNVGYSTVTILYNLDVMKLSNFPDVAAGCFGDNFEILFLYLRWQLRSHCVHQQPSVQPHYR